MMPGFVEVNSDTFYDDLRKKFGVVVFSFVLFLSSGCSVFMAANQPDKKNVDLFNVGTQRSLLIAEYGAPTVTEERDGKEYEIFKFVQGYSTGTKVGRAVFMVLLIFLRSDCGKWLEHLLKLYLTEIKWHMK